MSLSVRAQNGQTSQVSGVQRAIGIKSKRLETCTMVQDSCMDQTGTKSSKTGRDQGSALGGGRATRPADKLFILGNQG